MAKDRAQVRDLPGPVQLTPQAAPVDTYHTPGTQPPPDYAHSDMAQLASALGDFSPKLLALGGDLKHEQNYKEGTQGGISAQQYANRAAFNQAIKDGKIPEAASPWFLRGANEQFARVEGDQYDAELRKAYSLSDSSHDPDITGFMQGFNQKYMADHGLTGLDTPSQQVLQQSIARSQANLSANHIARWQEEQSQIVRDRLYKEVQGKIDSSLVYQSADAMGADIAQRTNALVVNGVNGTEANQVVVNAIRDKAKQLGDPNVLDLLDKVDTGNGPLGKTAYAKEQRLDAINEINSRYWSNISHQSEAIQRQRKIAGEQLRSDFIQDIESGNPNFDLHSYLVKAAQVDPDIAESFRAYKNNRDTQLVAVHEAPEVIGKLSSRIYDVDHPLTHADVVEATNNRQITGDTALKIDKDIAERDKYSLLDDNVVKLFYNKVGSSIAGSEFVRTPELSRLADEGQVQFSKGMVEYISQHPNGNMKDKMDYAEGLMNQIVRIQAPKANQNTQQQLGTDQQTDIDATEEARPVSVHEALSADPKKYPVDKVPLYPDQAQFDQAIKKYNVSRGAEGSIVKLAAKYNITPTDLIAKQKALLSAANKPKK